MARKTDVLHETNWTPSAELRFTVMFLLASWAIVAAVMETSLQVIGF